MAVASDAIYNGTCGSVVSYVSSNAYYGYVPPPCRPDASNLSSGPGSTTTTMTIPRCSYDTAMETDDDGYEYPTGTRCLNNHCVIPEATTTNRLVLNGRRPDDPQHHRLQRQQEQLAVGLDTDTLRRRNRKRCSSDLDSASELKKFREEAVVMATFTMVQDVQRMDWPRCVISRHHCG